MIGIIDYGLGNVRAFENAYRRMNVAVRIVKTPDELHAVSRMLLPGVGAFDFAMERLERSGFRKELDRLVVENRVPILGVCVGMQIFAGSSDEGGRHGLGWIEGRVRRFGRTAPFNNPLPHMGWNDVVPTSSSKLFDGLAASPRFYFLHSFVLECDDQRDSAAVAEYGGPFTCSVNRSNIFGVQFHPEKSHHNGMMLLKNFAECRIEC